MEGRENRKAGGGGGEVNGGQGLSGASWTHLPGGSEKEGRECFTDGKREVRRKSMGQNVQRIGLVGK